MAGSDLEPESDEFGDRVDGVAIIGVGVVDLAARNTVDQRSAAFESLGSCVGEAGVKGARDRFHGREPSKKQQAYGSTTTA